LLPMPYILETPTAQ